MQLDWHPSGIDSGLSVFPAVTTFAVSGKYWNRVVAGWDGIYKSVRESEVLRTLILVEDEKEKRAGEGKGWKLIETHKGSCPAVHDMRMAVWRAKRREELWERWDQGRVFERRGPVVEIKFARVKMCGK